MQDCNTTLPDTDRAMKSRQSWADLYAFELIRESDTPLFRQLYLQLRAAILSRRLRPGTKLPSTRELAAQLGVSRSAAVAAYEQLLAEGYTSGRHGSGTYISPDLPEPIEGGPQRRRKPAAPDHVQSRANAAPRRFRRCHGAERSAAVQPRTHADRRQDAGAMAQAQCTYLSFAGCEPFWLFRPARNDRTSKGHLRLPAGGPRGEMRPRTDRGHGGNAAGDRHRHPDPCRTGTGRSGSKIRFIR